jgi:hypothetical protein
MPRECNVVLKTEHNTKIGAAHNSDVRGARASLDGAPATNPDEKIVLPTPRSISDTPWGGLGLGLGLGRVG